MDQKIATRIAASVGLLAVVLGAFGAHALKGILDDHHTVAVWDKAVFYHFIHAVMMFVLARSERVPRGPFVSFLAGIVLFSGSLYLLALTSEKKFGAITPFGGVSFLVGWAWLGLCAGRKHTG